MMQTQTLTLRVPRDLKRRLENESRRQGVSLNQLAGYLLASQITQLEMADRLEARLQRRSLSDLRGQAKALLAKIPARPVPDWDTIPD